MRILDLFCGIGGVAEATRGLESMHVIAAVDINRASNAVYQLNHGIQPACQTLESIRQLPATDLVWLSPPCQPYTRRGQQREELDPRSLALSHLIQYFERYAPAAVILENVPEFEGSHHHHELESVLQRQGHATSHQILCPTQWGVPMRRRRFYLRSIRGDAAIPSLAPPSHHSFLSDHLDETAWNDDHLRVTSSEQQRFQSSMNILAHNDPKAVASCFTSAYGSSPVRSGSYLHCEKRKQLRRFSPREVASLMGYRQTFRWPSEFSIRNRYRMLGNALSVTVTRCLLSDTKARMP